MQVESNRFDWVGDVEIDYLAPATLKTYLDNRYKTIHKANEYMQTEQPRKKLKDENSRESGIRDLQFLLWVVKQLAVLSAPILVDGFSRMKVILGNDAINLLDSSLGSE